MIGTIFCVVIILAGGWAAKAAHHDITSPGYIGAAAIPVFIIGLIGVVAVILGLIGLGFIWL